MQYVPNSIPQVYAGRPRFRGLRVQRFEGKVTDQGFSLALCDSTFTSLFHLLECQNSIHDDVRLVTAGGPTTMRISPRYSTSNLARSSVWMAQCDAPKRAIGEINALPPAEP